MDEMNFNENIIGCQVFSGRMNMMANSIDLLISAILEKLGHNLNRKPLGPKIGLFRKSEPILSSKYSGEFDLLIDRLDRFNANWNATKHGMMVGGTSFVTFQKNGLSFIFDPKKIAEIDREFTETIANLTEIWNMMLKEEQKH